MNQKSAGSLSNEFVALMREIEGEAALANPEQARHDARDKLAMSMAKHSDSSATRAIQRAFDPARNILSPEDFSWLKAQAFQFLLLAVSLGKADCVEELLRHTGPVGANSRGETPLMRAAQMGHDKVMRLLLPRSRPDDTDQEGRTALMIAATADSADGVRFLVAHTSPNVADREGRTALMTAAMLGLDKIVEILLPFSDPSLRDCDGCDALFLAAEADHWLVVRRLVPHGALRKRPCGRADAAEMAIEMSQWRCVNELAPLLSLPRMRALMDSLDELTRERLPAILARVEQADLRAEIDRVAGLPVSDAGFKPSRL